MRAAAAARSRWWLLLVAGVAEAALVAHYAFEGGAALDDSGNGYDGTVTGGSAATGGDLSGALFFDGVDDKVGFPSDVTANILAANPRTICVWAALALPAPVDGWSPALFNYGSYEDGREHSTNKHRIQ